MSPSRAPTTHVVGRKSVPENAGSCSKHIDLSLGRVASSEQTISGGKDCQADDFRARGTRRPRRQLRSPIAHPNLLATNGRKRWQLRFSSDVPLDLSTHCSELRREADKPAVRLSIRSSHSGVTRSRSCRWMWRSGGIPGSARPLACSRARPRGRELFFASAHLSAGKERKVRFRRDAAVTDAKQRPGFPTSTPGGVRSVEVAARTC
jgi:hypothetical protein